MSQQDKSSKTEKPTPKKLKEARKEGQTPRTPELAQWLTLLVASFVLPWTVRVTGERCTNLLLEVQLVAEKPDDASVTTLLKRLPIDAGVALAPLALSMMLIGVAAFSSQGGLFLATKAAKPKWKKLNPLPGIKRMFGSHGFGEAGKALFKAIVFSLLAAWAIWDLVTVMTAGGAMPLGMATHLTWEALIRLLRICAAMGLVFAAADYALKRHQVMKNVRMSHQEIKQENKQSEGDPHQKGHRRSQQLAMSRNRMMADVASADVVLVNPTHVAVALRYKQGTGAPQVVAKGAGLIAARIRELAEENRVPLVRDVPLARALHASCNVGDRVPPEMYEAVARVLAFVFGLRARGRSAVGTHAMPKSALTSA